MRGLLNRIRLLYGAGPMHVLVMLACFALAAYTISVVGLDALWDPKVWWHSIVVWFLGAVILHDLALFPLYAAADRVLGRHRLVRARGPGSIPLLNHIRVPVLATGLTFLLFFPGILEQGAGAYHRATGQTQQPFLTRWLLLTAVFFGASALVYGGRVVRAHSRGPGARTDEPGPATDGADPPAEHV